MGERFSKKDMHEFFQTLLLNVQTEVSVDWRNTSLSALHFSIQNLQALDLSNFQCLENK